MGRNDDISFRPGRVGCRLKGNDIMAICGDPLLSTDSDVDVLSAGPSVEEIPARRHDDR
jgi:hypothetical protein